MLLVFCLTPVWIIGQDFEELDQAVLTLAPEKETSIGNLADALDHLVSTDWERVRAVWIWLTHNIEYDTEGFFGGADMIYGGEEAFSSGKAVCSGYSDLFADLAGRLGLTVKSIAGFAKGYGFVPGSRPEGTNHAWNAVLIDGEWRLFDSTWGAGSVDGTQFVWNYREVYFDADPEVFIFDHFPEDPADQFRQDPIDREVFFRLPALSTAAFEYGISLDGLLERAKAGERLSAPLVYECKSPPVYMEVPVTSRLEAGESYTFRIDSPASTLLLKNGSHDPEIIQKRNGIFSLTRSFDPGDLVLFLSEPGDNNHSYSGILFYYVE